MALTSLKMGLLLWNQLQDPYDHNQLSSNFSKLDFHDHTPGRGVLIPTEGIADDAITRAKLEPTIDVDSAYTAWKVGSPVQPRASVNTAGAGVVNVLPLVPTSTPQVVGTSATVQTYGFHLDPAGFAVAGRTTQFRLRTQIATNAVAPGGNITVALQPISGFAGASGADVSISSLGAAVLSDVFTAPSASTRYVQASTPATMVANWYALTVVFTNALAANARVAFIADIEARTN